MKSVKGFIILSLIIFVLILANFSYVFAVSEENNSGRVYLIVLNRYSMSDIKKVPQLEKLVDEGSIGLMNTRGVLDYNGADSFLTINSSCKAQTNEAPIEFYNSTDKILEIYERRNGNIEGEFDVANISLNKLNKANENNSYMPYIGALGDNLHEAGLKTAIYGNSDTIETTSRLGALIPMDSKGLIDYGNVDNVLIEDAKYPYGIKTDYDGIMKDIQKLSSDVSLVVIETGDLDRLNFYKSEVSDDIFQLHRDNILNDINNFIYDLIQNISDNDMIMILSPNASDDGIEKSKLSPLIIWGQGVPKGILLSSTTRRDGIVANIDIAPTITNYLNAPNTNFSGNKIDFCENKNNYEFIKEINEKTNVISKTRSPALITYSSMCIFFIIYSLVILLSGIKIKGSLYKITNTLLTLILIIPIGFIVIPYFITNYLSFVMSLIIFSLSMLFIFYRFDFIDKLFYISGIIYGIIIIDVITRGNLLRFSVFGYDPIIGARYFGIGNEVVGLLLGNLAVFCEIYSYKEKNGLIPILLFLFSIIVVGYPKLGANVGGTIAIILAFLFYILGVRKTKINFKRIMSFCVIILAAVFIVAFMDARFNSNPTHLGRAFISTKTNGFGFLVNIAIRKLLMNIKLVRTSMWMRVLYTGIFSTSLIFILSNRKINFNINKSRNMYNGLNSGVVGSIFGFLVNDSGVVLSSISMIVIIISFMYITLFYNNVDNI